MDSGAPPPAPPAEIAPERAVVEARAAAQDLAPRNPREKELCEKASSPDWLYLGGLLAFDVAAVWVNSYALYDSTEPMVRHIGPMMIGLSWGATIGGGYLALPKCDANWVDHPPPEGAQRSPWPVGIALAMLAGSTAPVIMGVATQSRDKAFAAWTSWTTEERALRIVFSGVMGFAGALLPYVLPPRTWSAMKELDKLRVAPTEGGAWIGLSARF